MTVKIKLNVDGCPQALNTTPNFFSNGITVKQNLNEKKMFTLKYTEIWNNEFAIQL